MPITKQKNIKRFIDQE